jgi:hypothetical protein
MEVIKTVTTDEVVSKIYTLRGKKVMLDHDLAELYGVPTKRLNEQVKRNAIRFPSDFMFMLTVRDMRDLRSQFATSSFDEQWGGRRTMPYAFTEHGVLMLSSVLNSPTAIQVNIKIMRVYVLLRDTLVFNKDMLLKIENLEKQTNQNSEEIRVVFEAVKRLLKQPKPRRTPIGFRKDKC